jgi:hypothetical protein
MGSDLEMRVLRERRGWIRATDWDAASGAIASSRQGGSGMLAAAWIPALALALLASVAPLRGAEASDRGEARVLPLPELETPRPVGLKVEEVPRHVFHERQAPEGAPNVVIVLLDDVGFGAASTFGGLVPTPHIDELARSGLRYNRFHTTAICSPTRASLLTGRNSHAAGVGAVLNSAQPYHGRAGLIGSETATVAEILRQHGYATSMWGKWHLTPDHEAFLRLSRRRDPSIRADALRGHTTRPPPGGRRLPRDRRSR